MCDLNTRPLICIVEDDAVNAKLLAFMLGREYQICSASSGAEALRMIEDLKPDLILLDIMMDDIDGLDVCDQLKSKPQTSQIPIIFVTGLEDDVDQTKGFEAGASDYIVKPVSAGLLKARIDRVLQDHAQIQLLDSLLANDVRSLEEIRQSLRRDPVSAGRVPQASH